VAKILKERWMKLAGLLKEADDLEIDIQDSDDSSSEWQRDKKRSDEEEPGWDPADEDEWLAEELGSWHSEG